MSKGNTIDSDDEGIYDSESGSYITFEELKKLLPDDYNYLLKLREKLRISREEHKKLIDKRKKLEKKLKKLESKLQ